ncbi:AEL_collapsed_G0016220.mRNA.1.CDS.1 [Saccharomyces cerevisiae]|nr:AEL_collapsed_G0016220.mRNA.1.CDS.1 [Saccharomyces cerevisiae]
MGMLELVGEYWEQLKITVCAERVKIQQQQPGYADLEHKEDCVEEFFHLQHYLDTATAPRLFDKLK